ncbi:hypothetical protein Ndes2526B_g05451 [Nannochloris sp. 'desiccata']
MSGRDNSDNRRGGRGRGRGNRGRGNQQGGQQPRGYSAEPPQAQEWPSLGGGQSSHQGPPRGQAPPPRPPPSYPAQAPPQMQEEFPALGGGGWGPPPGHASQPSPQPMQYSQPSSGPVPMEASPAPPPALPIAQIPSQEINQQVISNPQGRRALANVPSRPLRPGFGKQGKPLKLLANWFSVDLKASELYHYAVHVKKLVIEEAEPAAETTARRRPARAAPSGPLPSLLCRAAMQKLATEMQWPVGCWAFDGRANMYTSNVKVVPGDLLEKEVITTLPGEARPVKFSIKVERVAILPTSALKDFLAGRSDSGLAPHHCLQALDVILKHRMGVNALNRPDIMAQGRSFLMYGPETQRQSIGGGAQIWMGYKQAVRPCQTGLALTVDTAAGAIVDVGNPAQPRDLTKLMYDILGGPDKVRPQGLDGRQVRMLESALRGLKVQATHNGFKRTIVGVARTTPFTEKFTDGEGRETTVANYFQRQYNVRLNDRKLPNVKIGNGKTVLPPEICTVLPKQRLGKLTGDQTAGMIKFAAQKPQDKIKFIQKKVQDVQGEAQHEMKTFGVSVGGTMASVSGRILPNPNLSYGGGKGAFNPGANGAWNLKDIKFLEGQRMESWAVVSFANRRWEVEDVPNFIREFTKVCKSCGISVADNPPLISPNPNSPAGPVLERAMQQAAQKFRKPADLILVILPDTGTELYREVKQAGDSYLGVPTQCVVAQKAKIGAKPDFKRGQLQYIANVALKVNAKLGGRNVVVSPSTINASADFLKQFGKSPFMVMSADVTHPGIGSSMPSLAAVVASMEATASKFACRLSCQPVQSGRQVEEIITDLKDIAKELLVEFYRTTNGKRPERLFFYRDGVSEGQFDQVVAYEYEALRQACAEMGDPGAKYAPPITFIVVQKRHQTRLFARDPRDADRSGNVLPGVVVDRDICHPFEFDFYLNSHAGLQGCNRPAHYHVLIDENRFGADMLQLFTYQMCYTFARCTRSIAVPAATRYAHLAAFRARTLMSGGGSEGGSVASVFTVIGANPVPPSGRFAYPGGPDLATGVWMAVAENSDSAVVMAVANAGGQLSVRQPSTGEVITTVINYISYECIDDNVFVATIEGISYPTLAQISQCSIYFINETHRAVNSLPLSGGKCPNAAFSGFNLGPNGAFVSSNIYRYVDGVLPRPTSFVCQNRTTATFAAVPPTSSPSLPIMRLPQNTTNTSSTTLFPSSGSLALPPAPAPPSPPSPFPTLSKSGGAAVPLGIWKTADNVEIITRDGFYAIIYDPFTNKLLAKRAKYFNHQCLDYDAYKATAGQFWIYLNGTTTPVIPSCETGKKRDGDGVDFLDIVVAFEGNECPSLDAVVGTDDGQPSVPFRFTLAEPLKGNPSTTCGAAPSSAPRAAGGRRYSITAIAAGVSAGIAVLLTT